MRPRSRRRDISPPAPKRSGLQLARGRLGHNHGRALGRRRSSRLGGRRDRRRRPHGRRSPTDRARRARRVGGADHYQRGRLDVAATAALVATVRASAVRACSAALDELAAALPGPVVSISLRFWPPDFPHDIAVQRRAPYEARADAIMYRQLLAELARARGWEVHSYDAKHVEARAADLLGERAEQVLRGPRATLGPPWAKDHRVALAATVVAGDGAARRRGRR